MKTKKLIFKVFIGVILLLIVFEVLQILIYICVIGFNENTVSEAIEKGNIIIANLEKFHNEKGYYPDNLSELVPEYIDILPTPGTANGIGKKSCFRYRKDNLDDCFSLSFRFATFSEYYYNSCYEKKWIYANH